MQNYTPAEDPVPPSDQGIAPCANIRALKKEIRRAGNRNGLLLIGIFLAANLLGSAAMAVWILLFGMPAESDYELFSQIISVVFLDLIAFPAALLVNRFTRKTPFRIRFQRPAVSFLFIAKWCVIGFGGAYAVNYIMRLVFLIPQAFGIEFHAPSMTLGTSPLAVIVTAVSFALIAPLMEELFFRGAMLNNVRPFGDGFAILMTAVMFGMFHMNYEQIFYAAALGLAAGFLCVKANSILPAIFLHFGFNVVGAVQSILVSRVQFDMFSPESFLTVTGHEAEWFLIGLVSLFCFCLMVLGIILLIIEIKMHRSVFHLSNPCPQISELKKATVYLTSPGTLAFFLSLIHISHRSGCFAGKARFRV